MRAIDDELGLASEAGTVRNAPASYSRAVLRTGEKGLCVCGAAHGEARGDGVKRGEGGVREGHMRREARE
jgi:hypothetical protein